MTIEKIKHAIKKLPPNELTEFRQWFEEYHAQTNKASDLAEMKATLKKLRGSFKGTGLTKALMKEKEFEKRY